MGRGRSFAGHKIVPPKGARWAPKPSKHARCVARQLIGKKGGGRAGVRERFTNASKACKAENL